MLLSVRLSTRILTNSLFMVRLKHKISSRDKLKTEYIFVNLIIFDDF